MPHYNLFWMPYGRDAVISALRKYTINCGYKGDVSILMSDMYKIDIIIAA